jgi:hypothetical protein
VTETAGTNRPARPARRRRRLRATVPTGPVRASAHVCQAASCLSAQSDQVFDALAERVAEAGLSDVAVKRVGCLGLCAAGPLVEIPRAAGCSSESVLTTSAAWSASSEPWGRV